MRSAARVGSFIDRILTAIAVILVAAIVVIVNVQVVGRYFLSLSLAWPEELARHVMVWAVFIGGALAVRRDSMIRVDWLSAKLPRQILPAFQLLRECLVVVVLLIVVWASIPLLGVAGDTAEPGAGIPARWVALALPVGVLLTALFTLARALRLFNVARGLRRGDGGIGRDSDSADLPGER